MHVQTRRRLATGRARALAYPTAGSPMAAEQPQPGNDALSGGEHGKQHRFRAVCRAERRAARHPRTVRLDLLVRKQYSSLLPRTGLSAV